MRVHPILLGLALLLPFALPAQDAVEPPELEAQSVDAVAEDEERAVEPWDEAQSVDDAGAPADAEPPTPQAADVSTAASTANGESHVTPPPQGKGQVVFFRERKFTGAAIVYKVREGEQELGRLSNGTYFVHVTEPGAHEYAVRSEARDMLNLEVEVGETHYVQGSITMGVLAGRPNLSPSDEATFNSLFDKLKPAKPLD